MAVIALDIGGTKIKAAIVSKSYSVLSSLQIPTIPKKGKNYFLQNIRLIINSLINGSKHKISAIGISLPGKLDEKGKLMDVGNSLSFLEGFAFKSYIEKYFSIPVKLENDANCFLLAESVLGVAKNYEKVLGIIWGSGVGGSFAVNNKILPFPMEFGHNKVFNGKKYVDLELVSGGRFILKNYKKLSGNGRLFSIPEIYSSKDDIAKKVFSDAVFYLGHEIAGLVNILKPDVIVLGGGLSQLPKRVYDKLFSQIKKYALSYHTKKLKLLRYGIADDAGLIGASILAYRK